MRIRFTTLLAAGLWLASALLAPAAGAAPADAGAWLAQGRMSQGFARQPSLGRDDLRSPITALKSRGQAIAEAVDRYGGEVLSARIKRRDSDDPFYEIRLITRGQVRVVRIDARAR